MDNREVVSQGARAAAYTMLAKTPTDVIKDRLAKARETMRQQDLAAVDPNGELDPEERERRAEYRRRERMARAGLASGRARRAAKAKADAAAEINMLIDVLASLDEGDAA